ncbi:tetratricopeptide repeat protein, partial [Arthrospira platensis SPKY1]|nr:tetratricopeptide repeat protein [Arthrospira platensis SPKY1]
GLENIQLKAAYQRVTYNLGNRNYMAKQYANAIDAYRKSLLHRIDPEIAALSHFWLAESYYQMMEFEEALKAHQVFQNQPSAINLPEYALSLYGMGYSQYKLQNFAAAATTFRKFVAER